MADNLGLGRSDIRAPLEGFTSELAKDGSGKFGIRLEGLDELAVDALGQAAGLHASHGEGKESAAPLGSRHDGGTGGDDGGVRGRGGPAVAEGARAPLAPEGGDEVLGDGRAGVVEDVGGAEALGQLEVARGCRGDDLVAGGGGELDGVAADGGGGAPDQEGLPVRAGVVRGPLQVEVVAAEEALDGDGEAERQDGGLLVGEGGRDGQDHVLLYGGALLEGRGGQGGHAVADLELGDARTDRLDLAGNVLAKDGGGLEPLEDGGPKPLHSRVDGVYGHGMCLDDDLVVASGGVVTWPDLEGGSDGREECAVVTWHGSNVANDFVF